VRKLFDRVAVPAAFLLLAIAIAGGLHLAYQHTWQLNTMRNAGLDVLHYGEIQSEDLYDWWGTSMCAKYEVEATRRWAIVHSAGADKEFGTDDDWRRAESDINKSYVAGRWAAEKAKEAAKGFAEGMKRDSKFE
jgi:hypothetical protein